MSKVSGVLLIMAGLGVAAYELAAGPGFGSELSPESSQEAPSQLTDISKIPPAAPVNLATASMPERIDPPLSRPAPAAAPGPQPSTVPAAPASRPRTPPPTTAAPASQPWPPFVTHAQHAQLQHAQRESAPSRLPLPPPQRAAIAPGDRAALARELQRELRRVGCYEGEINATWTTSTRRAMKAFTDRVNATLPVEEPDHVLLALVQSHPDNACGKPCPAGQGLSEAGRCLPNAILARAATKGSARLSAGTAPKGKAPEPPASAIVGWSTSTTVASPSSTEPPEGRMALSGPRTEGAAPTPAAPMPSAGVSVLPGPVPPNGVTERRRDPRHVQGSRRGSWARSFLKRRDGDGAF